MKGHARFPAAVALGLLLLFAGHSAGAANFLQGGAAPDFSLPDIDGKTVSLSGFRGMTVLIVFWSTWCLRCSEELIFLRDNFSGHEDVVVLLVNQDSEKMAPLERIVEMRNRLSLPFPILVDSGLVLWDRFGISALPTSVVIGKDGMIIFAEPNFYWDSPEKLLKAVYPD